MVSVRLMKEESSWLTMECQPLTIASFYEIEDIADKANKSTNIKVYIMQRVVDILTANPWLCGRLVREKNINGEPQDVSLCYSEDVENPQSYVRTITNDKLFARKDWQTIGEIISPYLPKKGNLCIDNGEQLCKFIIFQNNSLMKKAIVFSLNHSIGDGHTLYFIWKMLDRNEEIQTMNITREYDFENYVKRDTNFFVYRDQARSMANSLKGVVGMTMRSIGRIVVQKPAPSANIYKINSTFVRKIKAKYKLEDSFVSTNDILNSWIFGSDVCNTDNVLMSLNMRNRLPEIHDDMAGNYEILGLFRTADFESAERFREKWTGIMCKKLLPCTPPSFQDILKHTCANMTTNWATFYHEINLIGFQHCFHLPIIKPERLCSRIVGVPMTSECWMILFKIRYNEHAIIFGGYHDLSDEYLNNCEVLDGKVLIEGRPCLKKHATK